MNTLTYSANRCPVTNDDEARYAEWGAGVRTREALEDHIFASLTMYAWRKPYSTQTELEQFITERKVAAPSVKIEVLPLVKRKHTGIRLVLLAACCFCGVSVLSAIAMALGKTISFSAGFLAGFAFLIASYEFWLLARRVVRDSKIPQV